MGLQQFRELIEQKKGSRDELKRQLVRSEKNISQLKIEQGIAEQALAVIQLVAQETQGQLKYQLSELPKLALHGVFDDPYGFEIDFEIRRGKTEADFFFVRDGQKMVPKGSSGLGSVDIAGTALRPALWSLRMPRNRPCIFLDEPFKHLKGKEANSRALAMLKEICEPRPERNWPGLQIIMVADERAPREEIIHVADRVFEFSIKNRITKVKVVKK